MKAILYNATQEAPSAEVVEPKVLARYFANFDESFFTFCEKGINFFLLKLSSKNIALLYLLELAKINIFYSEKLAEATRKYATLSSELSAAQVN